MKDSQGISGTIRTSAMMLLMLLAVFTALADVAYRDSEGGLIVFLLKVFIYIIIYAAALMLADRLFAESLTCPANASMDRFFSCTRTNILRITAVLSAYYFIYLIIYYPGTCGYDTVNQIEDLITGMEPRAFNWLDGEKIGVLMNDHHPVFTTLVFTCFYKLGRLMGNANTGMFLYCVLQILIQSFLFSYVLCSLGRFGIPSGAALAGMILYCMPFTAAFSVSMIKDTMFSLVFAAYYLFYIQVMRAMMDGREAGRRDWVMLILFSVLAALCNKKGIYIVAVSDLVLLLKARKKQERIFAAASVAVPLAVITIMLNRIIFPVMNIYPGGPQESMGFAFHQTAKTMITFPEEFSEEDRQAFYNILDIAPEKLEETFSRDKTDSIKDHYKYDAVPEDRRAFLKVWLKTGLRHPLTYLKATFGVCGGYFVFAKSISFNTSAVYYESLQGFKSPDALLNARKGMTGWFNWLRACQPIAFLFSNALYMWWIPAIIALLLFCRGEKQRILLLLPIAANVIFLILGPVCWTRYGLCQIYTVPLQLAALYVGRRDRIFQRQKGPQPER